jgi:hypothetical protein
LSRAPAGALRKLPSPSTLARGRPSSTLSPAFQPRLGHRWLESQDLEFHHIYPSRGFGLALAQNHGFWNPTGLERAKREPPADSRACARSRLMRKIQRQASSYFVDWEEVSVPNQKRALLLDPFRPSPEAPRRSPGAEL